MCGGKIMHGKQLVVTIYMDDVKSSHVEPIVNDDFIQLLYCKYGDPDIGEVKVTRGKSPNYLRMALNYSEKGNANIDMRDYIKQMINGFPIKFDKNDEATTPAN